MKIAVIGAGPAGLAAIKNAVEDGHECDCFEQTGALGGVWIYQDATIDEYGLPIHSAMYKGLRTNLPKELMGYEDFPYPDFKESYIDQETVLKYIHDYARHFQLEKYIQYHKRVTNVLPLGEKDGRWLIDIEGVKSKKTQSQVYDAVIVCNGHFHEPLYPTIDGVDAFRGTICHSHKYRTNDPYTGLRVLVVGAGPSGTDIANIISACAQRVFLSHNMEITDKLKDKVVSKPEVQRITEGSVIFSDGSEESIDSVLYCTGYKFSFPFLSKECGIFVEDNHVQPMYKQIINIEHPTMCLIGLPFKAVVFPLFCIQIRFFLASLNGTFKVPPKEVMLQDSQKDLEKRLNKGWPKRHAHKLGTGVEQAEYFADLSATANIKNLPIVLNLLYDKTRCKCLDACFKIIDDETFIKL